MDPVQSEIIFDFFKFRLQDFNEAIFLKIDYVYHHYVYKNNLKLYIQLNII